jgi:hypothetical protein
MDKIYAELKAVPVTMILMALLYIIVGSLYHDHVSIAEVSAIKDEMSGVRYTLRHDHLDTRLHAVATEMFDLSQRVNEDKVTNKPIDPIYLQRLNDLSQQEEDLKREISTLENSGVR